MEVEVVAGQVGEHRRVESRPRDPPEGERVRGDLHRRRRGAGVAHPAQGAEQVRGLRRRPPAAEPEVAEAVAEGAEQPRRPPGGVEEGGAQRGHRRLAVGAGDPDQGQLAVGVAVGAGGERSEQGVRVGGGQPGGGHGAVRRRRAGRRQHGHRAGGERLWREGGAIEAGPLPGDEEVARLDAARVVGDAADGDLAGPRRRPGDGEAGDQLAEGDHQVSSPGAGAAGAGAPLRSATCTTPLCPVRSPGHTCGRSRSGSTPR